MCVQGDGKVIITASFEEKMQTVRLPVIETEGSLWDFMEILFEELRCSSFYSKEKIVKKRRLSSESAGDTSPMESDRKKRVMFYLEFDLDIDIDINI